MKKNSSNVYTLTTLKGYIQNIIFCNSLSNPEQDGISVDQLIEVISDKLNSDLTISKKNFLLKNFLVDLQKMSEEEAQSIVSFYESMQENK